MNGDSPEYTCENIEEAFELLVVCMGGSDVMRAVLAAGANPEVAGAEGVLVMHPEIPEVYSAAVTAEEMNFTILNDGPFRITVKAAQRILSSEG